MFRRWFGAAVVVGVVAGTIAGLGVSEAAGGDLDRFTQQRLDWQPCHDDTLDKAGAQCADVTVPLNYAEPQGRTITVAISRVPAADQANRRGIMLSNPGGPGGLGLTFTVEISQGFPSYQWNQYDLIGMDPRGIGRSTPVHCRWPFGTYGQSAGVDLVGFGKSVATQADLAARCQAAEGDKLPYITTRNTARDMDVIRAVLGADRINYFGASYGTYLGAVFTQLFPERSDRIVLDSAVDPEQWAVGTFRDMGAADEAALDAWADWTAARDGEYRLGATRSDVRAVVTGLIAEAARQPIRIGSYDVDEHWLPTVIFENVVSPSHFDVLAGMVRQFADAAAGAPVQPSAKLQAVLSHFLDASSTDEADDAGAAVRCGDVSESRDPSWYWHNIEASRVTQPVFGPLVNNISPCAFWRTPVEPPTAVHNSVPALILQATGDPLTAHQQAVGLHRVMTASRMVTLQDVIVHGVITIPSTCTKQALDAYLRDRTLPTTDLTCHAD
ncbi:alpha/beta hydrolase [Nocardia sp. NBC_01499]|uniref:alpha/beta fold hydrolase n=1 Tax=Nocardia sp. NBC_01499 TaxID=2903597 RepID=UPI00386DB907